MKLQKIDKNGKGRKVAQIALGKDELKLIWSMAKNFEASFPKLILSMPTKARLKTLEKGAAEVIRKVYDEAPSQWREPEFYEK